MVPGECVPKENIFHNQLMTYIRNQVLYKIQW